jgi:hypothetical protein
MGTGQYQKVAVIIDMRTKPTFLFILTLSVTVSASSLLFAQDETPATGKWSFLIEPYVMFPDMRGDIALGGLPEASVEADDIFSHLQFGAMLYVEASNDTWNFNSDLLYMDLEQDIKSSSAINDGEISAKQIGWELAGLYKVMPWLEVGLGGLLNSITTDVRIDQNETDGGTSNLKKEMSQTWFDPMLVAVLKKNTPNTKVTYLLRGEIGGFGIGSDLAWQVQAQAGFHISEVFQLQIGYRIIGLDYETGSGSDHFLYDMHTSGPMLRFGFNF